MIFTLRNEALNATGIYLPMKSSDLISNPDKPFELKVLFLYSGGSHRFPNRVKNS
jgi:hypothetical protein